MSMSHLGRRVFRAGDNIFDEGDGGDFAYVVERGSVAIVRRRNGAERRLGIIPAGGIFGEMALLDGGARIAAARAIEETACLVVPRALVAEKLRKADPFLAALLRVMLVNARSALEFTPSDG
jgi:CRP/FNR family transcriptional regulator, cyclic AMP receptor protein